MLFGLAAATAAGAAAASTQDDPIVNEIDIEAGFDWFPVGGNGDSLVHAYAYNRQVPGPVLEAAPGGLLRIAFRNSLPETTNLHFHGLHVSPDGNGDNPFTEVASGESWNYELALPANHPSGLFWYHPHVHGTTARQLSRGLAGVILVRGEVDALVPEIQAAAEHLVILQDFEFDAAGEPVEPTMMDMRNGREGSLLTVNGVVNPAMTVAPGGLARLRILNASPSRFYRIRIDEHPMYVIGRDAGTLPAPVPVDEILLTPGERADVLVRGERDPGQEYAIWNLPYDRGRMGGPPFSATAPVRLATLRYEGDPVEVPVPADLPYSIDPLPAPPSTGIRTFTMSEAPGMMGAFFINGRAFDHHRVDTTVRLGALDEWRIFNAGRMDHPFHVHTNPFQTVDVATGRAEPGWKDVVLVPPGQTKRIRMRFAEFTGKTVYHCHILDHEDLGMMATLQINS